MDMSSSDKGSERVIRISLGWVLGGFVIVAVIGVLGGMVGQQIFQPTLPPLTGETDRLITTVQEVTISPSTAAAQVVERSHRSVVAIGPSAPTPQIVATGLVVTNDGLVVTTADLTSAALVAYDSTGRAIPLQLVGEDAVYGLTYFRMTDGVFVPLELRSDEAPVASHLLTLTRSSQTLQPRALTYTLSEYTVPPIGLPPGLQKLLRGTAFSDPALVGGTLLDEEGRVAGIVLDEAQGFAVSAGSVRRSIDRVIAGRREFDPFAQTGIHLAYGFTSAPDGVPSFTAAVQSVTPASPAANAGMRAADHLIAVGEERISWETSVAELLSQELPLTITIQRAGQEHTLTLQPPPQAL